MGQLSYDPAALLMYSIGQLSQTGYQIVVVKAQLPRACLSLFAHVGMAGYDQADTTLGQRNQKMNQFVRTGPLFRRHTFPCS